jgi:hypothetical protein
MSAGKATIANREPYFNAEVFLTDFENRRAARFSSLIRSEQA